MPKKKEIGFKFKNIDLSNYDEVCIPSFSNILLAVAYIRVSNRTGQFLVLLSFCPGTRRCVKIPGNPMIKSLSIFKWNLQSLLRSCNLSMPHNQRGFISLPT